MSRSFGSRTLSFKLVLLGDAAVGKSSVVERFVNDTFYESNGATIGASFVTASIPLDDDGSGGGGGGGAGGATTVKFEIWDTAGQERYRSLAPMYYRGAAAACVVFDTCSKDSFAGASSWVEELQRQGSADIVIALVGNKVDMAETQREVPTEQAKSYAEENGCLFFECSAKTGLNVSEIFRAVAVKLPKNAPDASSPADTIRVIGDDESGANSGGGGCCK